MKNTIMIPIFFLSGGVIHAQGFFNQKSAWIKNQIKQIALCQVYFKDLEKGYGIAKDGLGAIGNIKNGDFHLHLDHFNALVEINPVVSQYAKASAIRLMQTGIKKLTVKSSENYVNAVFTKVIELGESDIDQLNKLLSPGNYAMTDDDRLNSIDKLYLDMKDKYAFAQSFAGDVKMLSLVQLKEKNDVRTTSLLNGVKLP